MFHESYLAIETMPRRYLSLSGINQEHQSKKLLIGSSGAFVTRVQHSTGYPDFPGHGTSTWSLISLLCLSGWSWSSSLDVVAVAAREEARTKSLKIGKISDSGN